ncbi:MAG: polyprenol monophosphomannose synthase [Candidatus Glassbacteria bacterium]
MKTLVVIPTYNERENIGKLISLILNQDEKIDVLVVDDNSPDGTSQLISDLKERNKRIHLIQRERKLGLGSAYISGFKFALERGYDIIFEMDADFSHHPRYIRRFMKAIETNDLVIGSRYLNGVNVINWPLIRLILSTGASVYTRFITGMPIKDPTSGFKCFRRKVLETLDLDNIDSDGYSFQIEVNYKAWKRGLKVREIPIIFVDRNRGASKMNRKIIFEAIYMVWWLRIQSVLGIL